ncbi:hypothetical protein F511_16466 [Dorcoceras hygrometricum]|uniref:Retrotransposon gag domain-containing protein n=1 Tax=Dorcoceras hygrometricum TaxID=472368 RepID=A0A2Z7D8R3_9LAMI|nr:hypothetical protein F511_16466 [Dorcoceras hygrometricum]
MVSLETLLQARIPELAKRREINDILNSRFFTNFGRLVPPFWSPLVLECRRRWLSLFNHRFPPLVAIIPGKEVAKESGAPNREADVVHPSRPDRRRTRQVEAEVEQLAHQVDEVELVLDRFQRMNPLTFSGAEGGLLVDGGVEIMKEFRHEYIPESYYNSKEYEFNDLVQGNIKVAEYSRQFSSLTLLCPSHCKSGNGET